MEDVLGVAAWEWEAAGRVSATLAAEEEVLEKAIGRFQRKYLRALLSASTVEAEARAWESYRAYLTLPATILKPFSLAPGEADALLRSLERLAARARAYKSTRESPAAGQV
ncbi:MAG: hypothetical protein HY685_02410 [Chloroflexi bacterium]|nr:hypothetical protein [Chloroflexota bacterium]